MLGETDGAEERQGDSHSNRNSSSDVGYPALAEGKEHGMERYHRCGCQQGRFGLAGRTSH